MRYTPKRILKINAQNCPINLTILVTKKMRVDSPNFSQFINYIDIWLAAKLGFWQHLWDYNFLQPI